MQRVGAAQQLERRAHRDRAVILALDHGGADHVAALAPRHDVERMARVQQAHRPDQLDLARAHDHALAADAAQACELSARGEAAAVDDGFLCAAPRRSSRWRRPRRRPPRAPHRGGSAWPRRAPCAPRRHSTGRRRTGPRARAPARAALPRRASRSRPSCARSASSSARSRVPATTSVPLAVTPG